MDLLAQARAAHGAGDLESALRLWSQSAEQRPGDALPFLEAVDALSAAHRSEDARLWLAAAQQRCPDNFWVARRALAEEERRGGGAALLEGRRALVERFPMEAMAYVDVAHALVDAGDIAAAEAAVLQAMEFDPALPWPSDLYAALAVQRQDWAEAARRWALVRERCPGHARGYSEGVIALEHLGRQADAERLARQLDDAVRSRPADRDLLFTQAELASRRGDWETARRLWLNLVRTYPDDPAAHVRLGQSLGPTGRVREVEAIYREGLRRVPGDQVLSTELLALLLDQHALDAGLEVMREMQGSGKPRSSRFYQLVSRAFLQHPGHPSARELALVALRQPWEQGHAWLPEIVHALSNAIAHAINQGSDDILVAERVLAELTEEQIGAEGAAVFGAVDLLLFRRGSRGAIEALVRSYFEQGQTTLLLALSVDPQQNGRDFSAYGVADTVARVTDLMLAEDWRGLSPAAAASLAVFAYRFVVPGYRRLLDAAWSDERSVLGPEAATALRRWFDLQAVAQVRRSAPPTLKGALHIAFCVSGQLRGFRRARQTWTALGLDRHRVSTFVHVWSDVGRKLPVAPSATSRSRNLYRTYVEMMLELDSGLLRTWYPSFFAPVHVDIEDLKTVYSTDQVAVEDERAPRFVGMTNPAKMYHKIQRAHEMARRAGDFDLIVRIRPDKEILAADADWPAMAARSAHEGLLFADMGKISNALHNLLIGDQFAVGEPRLMDVYAAAADLPKESLPLGRPLVRPHVGAHETLALACFYHGVDVQAATDIRFGGLLEARPASPEQLLAMLEADIGGAPRNRVDEALLAACRRDLDEDD